jgi:S1-C subfamily serine protease
LAEIDRELLRRRESGERDEADGTVGAGTGFVIAVSGYVLTCDHVTRKSNHIEVRDNSGKKRAAKVVVADPKNDLCILYVEGLESPAIPTAPVNSVRTGEIVYSLGFPLQRNLENQNPVAGSGVVASLQGMAGDPRFLQVTVPLNPGNSGGPIIDVYGRWIGDTSLILTDRVVPKGLMPQGANFAVKATLINPLLDYLPKKELPLGSNSKSLTLAEAASRLSGSVVLITVKH